jgi:fatty-acyl-CoA synthase
VRPTAADPVPDLAKRLTAMCQVRVVDPEGRDVGPDEVGELWLRSPTMFSGYWAEPEATARAFAGGWFHTGDLVRIRADRRLIWVDRVAYMLKSGGENVYPAVIEQALREHPDVVEAVVVGRPDPRYGTVPVAFAATRVPLDAESLLDVARARLARYEVPAEVVFLAESEFPRGITGKILRRELEERARS